MEEILLARGTSLAAWMSQKRNTSIISFYLLQRVCSAFVFWKDQAGAEGKGKYFNFLITTEFSFLSSVTYLVLVSGVLANLLAPEQPGKEA